MGLQPEYLRLCHLLDDSLHHFSVDVAASCLTKELEKDLLISLSKVLRQVKQWTKEFESDEELLVESASEKGCSTVSSPYLDNHHCLGKIVGDLMSLLAVDSRYVQHLVGNTLMAISEFVVATETGWDDFIHLLGLCLELAFCSTLSSSGTEALDSGHSTSVLGTFLKQKLKYANWFTVVAIVRLLRGILKYLKGDSDENIMNSYLNSVSSFIMNVPWNLLDDTHAGHHIKILEVPANVAPLQAKVVQPSEVVVFFGHFIQFLCSFVEQSNSLENILEIPPVIRKISNLVPKLVAWFHTQLESPNDIHIFHYFRHKVLMLMIKLSSHNHIEDNIFSSWLCLLHKYFEDLLLQPIFEVKRSQDSSLEGLPFCPSLSHQGTHITSRHLQRLAVFLFLRCSLHLINAEGVEKCSCENLNRGEKRSFENLKRCSNSDQKFDTPECCFKCKGWTELHNWLQAHATPEIITTRTLYFQNCLRFTSSFIQLYMHEDDILFEMLLQLFSVPFPTKCQTIEGGFCSEDRNDIALASDIFNPVNMFHLFLAEILYDHQVLLDYLISNDTGPSCAEYLLRSLRLICNSWDLFVEFPGVKEVSGQSCSKRQKIDTRDFKNMSSSPQSSYGGTSSLKTGGVQDHTFHEKLCGNYILPFAAARDCLVSLRASISSLKQKNLFPYNPQVLLQRLLRFDELCNQGKK